MKLENFSNLFFVVSVLVPGFIYCGVIANFVPLRRSKEKEIIFLRYITATSRIPSFDLIRLWPRFGAVLYAHGLAFIWLGHDQDRAFAQAA